MQLQKAQRNQVKLRIGLSGPSGYGKTYSALLLAYGITEDWSKIAIIDTENNSASLYSHLGDFNVLSLQELFAPESTLKLLKSVKTQIWRLLSLMVSATSGKAKVVVWKSTKCWVEGSMTGLKLLQDTMPF